MERVNYPLPGVITIPRPLGGDLLMKKAFQWAREVNPSQPLSMGIWQGDFENWGDPDKLPRVDRYMIDNSDIITFHAYDKLKDVQQ